MAHMPTHPSFNQYQYRSMEEPATAMLYAQAQYTLLSQPADSTSAPSHSHVTHIQSPRSMIYTSVESYPSLYCIEDAMPSPTESSGSDESTPDSPIDHLSDMRPVEFSDCAHDSLHERLKSMFFDPLADTASTIDPNQQASVYGQNHSLQMGETYGYSEANNAHLLHHQQDPHYSHVQTSHINGSYVATPTSKYPVSDGFYQSDTASSYGSASDDVGDSYMLTATSQMRYGAQSPGSPGLPAPQPQCVQPIQLSPCIHMEELSPIDSSQDYQNIKPYHERRDSELSGALSPLTNCDSPESEDEDELPDLREDGDYEIEDSAEELSDVPEDGPRLRTTRAQHRRGSSQTAEPEQNSSELAAVGNSAPARKRRSQVLPVPVPNLTKKSRGRRVPTVASALMTSGVSKSGRVHKCVVHGCGKCFARGEHLKRHVRSIHTNDKPHQCPAPGCGKDFSRQDNLRQHMKVHKRLRCTVADP